MAVYPLRVRRRKRKQVRFRNRSGIEDEIAGMEVPPVVVANNRVPAEDKSYQQTEKKGNEGNRLFSNTLAQTA